MKPTDPLPRSDPMKSREVGGNNPLESVDEAYDLLCSIIEERPHNPRGKAYDKKNQERVRRTMSKTWPRMVESDDGH